VSPPPGAYTEIQKKKRICRAARAIRTFAAAFTRSFPRGVVRVPTSSVRHTCSASISRQDSGNAARDPLQLLSTTTDTSLPVARFHHFKPPRSSHQHLANHTIHTIANRCRTCCVRMVSRVAHTDRLSATLPPPRQQSWASSVVNTTRLLSLPPAARQPPRAWAPIKG
jgi:hypothetical protein